MTCDCPDTVHDIRRRCFDSGSTWVTSDGTEHPDGSGVVVSDCGRYVSTEEIGNSERGIASWVRHRAKQCRQFGTSSNFQRSATHSDAQNAAVWLASGSYLSAIVGGPGTGKTHVIRRILELSCVPPEQIALCSFTAAAAKRMTVSTGFVARTIHKTLQVMADGHFLYNRNNLLPYRLIIIDEASTIDVVLANSLFRAIHPDCRVILVGDDDQFPSIGPGNVFSDLLSVIPSVRLRKLFRAEPDGLIAQECRAIIKKGRSTKRSYEKDLTKCFAKVPTSSTEESAAKAAEIIKFLIDKQAICHSESRIITPFWSTIEAVNNCAAVQSLYPYVPYLCTKNDYKSCVMNGELGQKKPGNDVVFFDSGILPSYASHVKLSYAQTAFSAQGNEWPAVVFIVGHTAQNSRIDRSCAYVAVSRAKQSAFIVGDLNAYKEIIKREKQSVTRFTMLEKLITR